LARTDPSARPLASAVCYPPDLRVNPTEQLAKCI
jgi:hypothetical protein